MVVGLALLASVSCSSKVREGRASSYIVIDRVSAVPGPETIYRDSLESDVLTNGSVYEDKGKIGAYVAMKDPGSTSAPNAPSVTNYITITRYHVRYVRSDGRNTQGVDVPYEFDGGATATLTGQSVEFGFVLVRVQAKMEAPLRSLINVGGTKAISTIAEVTLYGTDQAGNEVTATARISVNFADWADPKA